jgi:hydroxypyruvate reductase
MPKSLSTMRSEAEQIFVHALLAVDPAVALKKALIIKGRTLKATGQCYDLSEIENVYVVGAGKASASMAKALEERIIERITEGAITVKYGYGAPLKKIKSTEAGHPVPDRNGISGSQRITAILEKAREKDLVICLISGGGSALTPLPVEGLSLEDKETVTRLLLRCGATINELNTLRKHLSLIKGGHMAQMAFPARVINLMLSDVIGDPVDVIASGPCVPDSSTFRDCGRIIEKYHLREKLPVAVATHIRLGLEGCVPETPKPGDPVFDRVQNVIIGSNMVAIKAAEEKAREFGYRTLILSSFIQGETREVAGVHAAIAKEIHASGNPLKTPACILSGGETTVTVRGSGQGGRNQEFALAAALEIQGIHQTIVLCGGTDGTDGPTDAAGAIVDNTTIARAVEMKLDPHAYLDNNDSYHLFKELGELLITGPTNTNVMDVRIILAESDGRNPGIRKPSSQKSEVASRR